MSPAPTGPTECLLACDLGGTHVRTAWFDAGGAIHDLEVHDTPRDDPAAFAALLSAQVAALPEPPALAVIGVPGPVDYTVGRASDLPNLPGWEPYIDASRLANQLGTPVLLAHDADLGVLGVHRFGAGRGVQDLLYVTIGTGIGAGVVIGGRLLHGRRSLAEGGHMIVDRQTFETAEELGSGGAIERRTGERAERLVELVSAGDPNATALLAEVATAIGIAVANLVLCFMPQRVVIGGGLTHLGAPVLEAARDMLARSRDKHGLAAEDVVLAEHEHDVGLLGAYALWRDLADADWRGVPLRSFAPRVEVR